MKKVVVKLDRILQVMQTAEVVVNVVDSFSDDGVAGLKDEIVSGALDAGGVEWETYDEDVDHDDCNIDEITQYTEDDDELPVVFDMSKLPILT